MVEHTILQTKGLSKHFGKLAALDEVDVTIKKGQIHGLVGPNGSGKSTWVNVVSGLLPPTKGNVYFEGKDITGLKANIIAAKVGISRTFQLGLAFPRMTCLENVMVGEYSCIKAGILQTILSLPFTKSSYEEKTKQRALELLQLVGLAKSTERWGEELSWMECQLLQIARALAINPKLIILDEPTAGMGVKETESVASIIKHISGLGITIVMISHDVKLVMRISDWVSVLDFGHKVCEGPPKQVRNDPRVLEAYLGKE